MMPLTTNKNAPVSCFKETAIHKAILKKRGLLGLGKVITPRSTRITMLVLQALAFFSVIGSLIALPLYFWYYKKVALKTIESDNIAAIRERCLFNPSPREVRSLYRSELLKEGVFVKNDSEQLKKFKENHDRFMLAAAICDEGTKVPFYKYLIDTNTCAEVVDALVIASRNLSGRSPTRAQTKLSTNQFNTLSALFAVSERVRKAGGDMAALFSLLDIIADEGRELNNAEPEHAFLFEEAANIYLSLLEQQEPTPNEITLRVLPSLMKLSRSSGQEATHQFATRFSEHSYLRKAIMESVADYDTHFNECLKDKQFQTTDELLEALDRFQTPFNDTKALKQALRRKYGSENVEILLKYLEKSEPLVGCGGKSFDHSMLGRLPLNEMVQSIIPFLAETYGLTQSLANRVLDPETIDAESLALRMRSLGGYRKLAADLSDNRSERQPLAAKILELLCDKLVVGGEAGTTYLKNLKIIVEKGWSLQVATKYGPDAVAKGICEVLRQLAAGDAHDHANAVKDLSGAYDIFSVFNRTKSALIQQKVRLEVDIAAYTEKATKNRLVSHLPKLSKNLQIPERLVRSIAEDDTIGTLQDKMHLLHQTAAIFKDLCTHDKKREMALELLLAIGNRNLIDICQAETKKTLLNKLFEHACNLSKAGSYSPRQIAYALDKTIKEHAKLHDKTYGDALAAINALFGTLNESNEVKELKTRIQFFCLRTFVQSRAKDYYEIKNAVFDADARSFAKMVGDRFIPDDQIPTKATLKYVARVLEFSLDLHLANRAKPLSIILALDGYRNERTLFLFKELNAISAPKFGGRLRETIRHMLDEHHKFNEALEVDAEKMGFPVLFYLLPTFLRKIIPPEMTELRERVRNSIHKLDEHFKNDRHLNLELKNALRTMVLVQPGMNTSPDMVEPLFTTLIDFVKQQISASKTLVKAMDSEEATLEHVRAEFESEPEVSALLSKIIPNVIEGLIDLHEKNRRIKTIIRRGKTPLTIIKGSKEEGKVANKENAVSITLQQDILLNLFNNLGDNIEDTLKWIDRAPTLINGTGFIGRWFFNKIGRNLASKYIRENLQLQPGHVDFLERSMHDLVTVGLQLIPLLAHNHDIEKYFRKIRKIQKLIMEDHEVDVKSLTLTLLSVVKLFLKDLIHYKPSILASVKKLLSTAQNLDDEANA